MQAGSREGPNHLQSPSPKLVRLIFSYGSVEGAAKAVKVQLSTLEPVEVKSSGFPSAAVAVKLKVSDIQGTEKVHLLLTYNHAEGRQMFVGACLNLMFLCISAYTQA